MEERVRVDLKDGIADVRMVRTDKLNAIDALMFEALTMTGIELAANRSVRAVVLSGEGRAFCSGLDMATMASLGGGEASGGESTGTRLTTELPDSPAGPAQRCAWVWQEVPVPVIAAIHGVAYGAGLQLAMGADIRIVAPDARLSIRESHWGLIPDVAITGTLRNVVPIDIAKELTFTGKIVTGAEAIEYRLATHVSEDPHGEAMKLAAEIASRSPDAIRAAKKLWNEAPLASVAEGLKLERELQRTLIGSANQIEAVKANMQKRAPEFSDPE